MLRSDMRGGQEHWIADNLDDLRGWEILDIEPFKFGVDRYSVRYIEPGGVRAHFRHVYVSVQTLWQERGRP
jgi:hypothetical protein